jgi:hypothetical protein
MHRNAYFSPMAILATVVCTLGVWATAQPGLAATSHRPSTLCADTQVLVGSAVALPDRWRLTDRGFEEAGGMWSATKCDMSVAFRALFQFQITPAGGQGADGMALVIQNYSGTVIGPSGGGLGYGRDPSHLHPGIPDSLAVELDTFQNSENRDPNANHVSVHTRGLLQNSVNERYSLGSATAIPDLSSGHVHTVKVAYDPGTMTIYVDDLDDPVLTVAVDIVDVLKLSDGMAWIGLTAGTGGATENHDVLGFHVHY